MHNYAFWFRLHLFAYLKGYDFSRKCPPLHPYRLWWKYMQYFQQVVCHIMKSVSTCTYRYTYHDLVEVNAHPWNLDSMSHPHPLTLQNRIVQCTGLSRPYLFQGRSILTKPKLSPHRDIQNVCVGECLDQLHSLHLVCVKSTAVQIAKIQTSLHLYYRTKVIVQLACPPGQSGAGKRTVNVLRSVGSSHRVCANGEDPDKPLHPWIQPRFLL